LCAKQGSSPVFRSFPLAVWIEPKLGAATFGIGFGFTPALLIRCLKRAQASHFIEDAFRVELAFQPLERAIHWFAFSNNDFWHQFTSIPRKFAHSNPGQSNLLRPSTPRQLASGKALSGGQEGESPWITPIKRIPSVGASSRLPAWFASR